MKNSPPWFSNRFFKSFPFEVSLPKSFSATISFFTIIIVDFIYILNFLNSLVLIFFKFVFDHFIYKIWGVSSFNFFLFIVLLTTFSKMPTLFWFRTTSIVILIWKKIQKIKLILINNEKILSLNYYKLFRFLFQNY